VAVQHVPFVPCPLDLQGAIEHELFRGCAPAPYNEPLAPCPHGECPKPCRVDLAGGGMQRVTYDDRGQMIHSQGNADRLLDQACTYERGRVAECHLLYEDRPITTQKVWRDPVGHIIGTSNGEPMVGFDPHYTWSNGHVAKLDSSMQQATFTYAGDRLIALDQEDMGDKKRITYKYDADGDVIASSRDGVYLYDARKRLVSGRKLKLEWDDRDRLIRSTVGDISYTYTYECR
jgi:YD repeat-containing protein